jgi:F0F1-type ATP synthase assembly protein I
MVAMPSTSDDAIRSHLAKAIIHLEEAVRAYFAYGTNVFEKRAHAIIIRVTQLAILISFFIAGTITTVYGLGEIFDRALACSGEGKLIVGFLFSITSGIFIVRRVRELRR